MMIRLGKEQQRNDATVMPTCKRSSLRGGRTHVLKTSFQKASEMKNVMPHHQLSVEVPPTFEIVRNPPRQVTLLRTLRKGKTG